MISSHPVLAVVLAVGTAYSVLAAPVALNALPGDHTLESVAPTLSSSSSLPIQTDSTGNSHRSGIPTTIEPVLGPQPTAPSTNFGDGSSSTVSENLNSHTSTVQGITLHQPRAADENQKKEADKEPMKTAIKEEIQDLENKIPPSHDAQQTVTHSSSKEDDVAMVDAHSTESLDVHMHGYSHLHSPQSQSDTDMGGVSHGSPMSLDPPSPHQARSVFGSGQPLSTNSHIPSPYRARSLFDLYGDYLD
ncbi:hypothetical protein EV368DRAFT_82085 [Lentinula lateritia]|nr:hypothetical protein EV368DRAFT_82085 [Lentinula lateritia]